MNITNCPKCRGHVSSESIGWKCDRCSGFIDMNGNFYEYVERPFMPPMTNADRIRAMSDEELAAIIYKPFCDKRSESECKQFGDCAECALNWLQHPAEPAEGE